MTETSELILPDQTESLQYKATTVKYYECIHIFALHTRHSNRIRLHNVVLRNLYPVPLCRSGRGVTLTPHPHSNAEV
jgi:hypothetical protein